ncbi:thiomuracin/GE37468 family thiazolyl RiPP peptide [Thermogemmatispora onikobensis]|uniref:thiomuracin/GE37468 family thiazolyl RiPP peptide n=1 Tax=Thermogemmatispora onikobensis TaxID=732234 RepID=UPI000853DAFC
MEDLRQELSHLNLDELQLDDLSIQPLEADHSGLEALTLGHGMIEIGASILPTACCSCCIPCCCCC